MGEAGSCSDGWAILSKSLIQFSIDGCGCVPSLFFDLRPNYGRVVKREKEKEEALSFCFQSLHGKASLLKQHIKK